MRRGKRWLGLLIVAAIVACGGDSTSPGSPKPFTVVTGDWAGTVVLGSGSNAPLALSLSQSGVVVTGSGQVGTIAATVNGTFVEPTLTLTLAAPGYASVSIVGTYDGSATIAGTFNGSGFANGSFRLVKQP